MDNNIIGNDGEKIYSSHLDLRFCKVRYADKKPFESDWVNKPYTWEEIQEHIKNSTNFGVLCGYGDLIVVDCDEKEEPKELTTAIKNNLPKTFTIKTGSGGTHYYFFCKDLAEKKIVLKTEKKHYGEMQAKGAQVVAAGSKHPNGNIYSVIDNIPIAHVDKSLLLDVLKPFMQTVNEEEKRAMEFNKELFGEDDISSIPITSVISTSGFKRLPSGEYQGQNPWHGSSGGINFNVNTSKNIAFCWRCNAGVSVVQAIALNEGIISNCGDEVRGEKFIEVKKIAIEKYGYVDKYKEKEHITIKDVEHFTSLKFLPNFEPGKEVLTKIIVSDIIPGVSLIKGFTANCEECGKNTFVYCRSEKRCKKIKDIKFEMARRLEDPKAKPCENIRVDFKTERETGYECTCYDPTDMGSNPLFINVFFANKIMPKDKKERQIFETDIQVKELLIKAIMRPKQSINPKVDDWYLDVEEYKFEEKKIDINYDILNNYEGIEKNDSFFQNYFCPSVYGKVLTKKVHALNLLSPFKIRLPNGEVSYGVINCLEAGDPGQAKTVLAKKVLEYCQGTNASLQSIENSTNRGLLASAIKSPTTGQWMIKMGEIPKRNSSLVYLDGIGKMDQMDFAQLRGIQEEHILQVHKAASVKKECAVRFYAMGNLVNKVDTYFSKHQASYDLAVSTGDKTNKFSGADRRRYHHVLIISNKDTLPSDINKHTYSTYKNVVEKDIIPYWNNLRVLAWSLKEDDFIWEEKIEDYIREIIEEINKKYEEFSLEYGILSKAAIKMFSVQLSSVALLHNSLNEEKNKVIIKKEHVDWLKELYEEEFHELGLDIEIQKEKEMLTEATEIINNTPVEILKILALLAKYRNKDIIEKKENISRQTIWRKMNEPIFYTIKNPDGSKKDLCYIYNRGTVIKKTDPTKNYQTYYEDDLLGWEPINKRDGTLTKFGEILVKISISKL